MFQGSKDLGPEGLALVHPEGVTVTSCVQVSGVRCQAERQSVGKSALVETPYLNVKASEITLLIADT